MTLNLHNSMSLKFKPASEYINNIDLSNISYKITNKMNELIQGLYTDSQVGFSPDFSTPFKNNGIYDNNLGIKNKLYIDSGYPIQHILAYKHTTDLDKGYNIDFNNASTLVSTKFRFDPSYLNGKFNGKEYTSLFTNFKIKNNIIKPVYKPFNFSYCGTSEYTEFKDTNAGLSTIYNNSKALYQYKVVKQLKKEGSAPSGTLRLTATIKLFPGEKITDIAFYDGFYNYPLGVARYMTGNYDNIATETNKIASDGEYIVCFDSKTANNNGKKMIKLSSLVNKKIVGFFSGEDPRNANVDANGDYVQIEGQNQSIKVSKYEYGYIIGNYGGSNSFDIIIPLTSNSDNILNASLYCVVVVTGNPIISYSNKISTELYNLYEDTEDIVYNISNPKSKTHFSELDRNNKIISTAPDYDYKYINPSTSANRSNCIRFNSEPDGDNDKPVRTLDYDTELYKVKIYGYRFKINQDYESYIASVYYANTDNINYIYKIFIEKVPDLTNMFSLAVQAPILYSTKNTNKIGAYAMFNILPNYCNKNAEIPNPGDIEYKNNYFQTVKLGNQPEILNTIVRLLSRDSKFVF